MHRKSFNFLQFLWNCFSLTSFTINDWQKFHFCNISIVLSTFWIFRVKIFSNKWQIFRTNYTLWDKFQIQNFFFLPAYFEKKLNAPLHRNHDVYFFMLRICDKKKITQANIHTFTSLVTVNSRNSFFPFVFFIYRKSFTSRCFTTFIWLRTCRFAKK